MAGTTIFSTMSALAAETGAINLSQGFPDFPLDPEFKVALSEQLSRPVHQYAPMQGLLPLRETISEIIERQYKRTIGPENILITAGATQAIFTTIQALVSRGDEVITIDPAYDCYRPAVDLAGGEAIHIPLTEAFEPDMEKLSSAMNMKTRMLILNNPHNPSGTVFTKKQMDALSSLLERFPECLILADEVYEFICFSNEAVSLNGYPQLWDRSIIISSFGKTLHITGWKVGYLTAPDRLLTEIKKVHQFLVFSVNHFAQAAIHQYLQHFDLKALSSFFAAKRDILQTYIERSGLKLMPCRGTYFQVVDITGVTAENDVDYAVWLTKMAGLATIPLSVFYNSPEAPRHYLRLCFAKEENTLHRAGAILCGI